MLALFFAFLSFAALMLAFLPPVKNRKILKLSLGLGTSVFAALSMYFLHLMLIASGKSTSMLGAVFGPWGRERWLVPLVYLVFMAAGVVTALWPMQKTGQNGH